MTQDWTFNSLNGNGTDDSTGADYASDDAQVNSSADEKDAGYTSFDQEMSITQDKGDDVNEGAAVPPSVSDHVNTHAAGWQRNGVMSVPPADGDESDQVAEIHLGSEKEATS